MLELATQSEDVQLYTCTAALFFSAFMLEAYFNHIGQERHGEKWEAMEKSKAWRSKYSKFKNFAAEAGWTVDEELTTPQYCSVREIFEFRDALAHGRKTKVRLQSRCPGRTGTTSPRWRPLPNCSKMP